MAFPPPTDQAERTTLETIPECLLRELKSSGCSDVQIANMLHTDAEKVRQTRLTWGIVPHVRQVDTTAGEHHAEKVPSSLHRSWRNI